MSVNLTMLIEFQKVPKYQVHKVTFATAAQQNSLRKTV